MKKLTLLIGILLLFISCSSNDDGCDGPMINTQNKVLLLQVDFTTNAFQGGKELIFPATDNFTISAIYHSPGDFGDITLIYDEVGDTIFSGSLIWNGNGTRSYPEVLNAPDSFELLNNAVAIPENSSFTSVDYGEFSFYPETIDYEGLWGAIDHLQLVKEYREANPSSNVMLFLYTSSVGLGNPEEWSWIVLLKN